MYVCAEGVKGEDEKNGGRGARRKIKVNFVLSSLRLLTMGMTMALCVAEMLTGVKVHHIKSIKEKKKAQTNKVENMTFIISQRKREKKRATLTKTSLPQAIEARGWLSSG